MNRRNFLKVAGGATAGVAASGYVAGEESGANDVAAVDATPAASSKPKKNLLTNGSFEDGFTFDPWTVGTDLPVDVATGLDVGAGAGVYSGLASDGHYALSLSIDGRHDDGTVWVQQAADLSNVETISLSVFSPTESFNTLSKVAVYAGPDPRRPLMEADFDTTRAVEDHAGWTTYEYPVDYDRKGVVAVGISVVWETYVRRLLDDVRLV